MASCSTLSLILIALLRASMYIINSVYDFGKTLMSRSTVKVWLIGLAWDDWRIRINDGSCLIENTADGDGILEGRGIERDEGGTTVGETGGGAESELEGLFEEETTKDHEVVRVWSISKTLSGLRTGSVGSWYCNCFCHMAERFLRSLRWALFFSP
ncbi:hypothetical protein KCU87_g63, partial [Aureobasidium melanogenum]